jgi:hypothetical protein
MSTFTYIINLNQGVGNVEDKSDKEHSSEPQKFDEVLENTQDVLSTAQYGLKTYRLIRNFFKIVFNEQYALQMEIDSFFAKADKLLINKSELLEVLSLEKYYEQVTKLVETDSPIYQEMNNELVYQANDLVDKLRHFLIAIDNLRHLGLYYNFEAVPHKNLEGNWDDKNTLQKVSSGEEMLTFILALQEKTTTLGRSLPSGVEKLYSVRQDCLKILREMYKMVPLKNNASLWSVTWVLVLAWAVFQL